MIKLKQLHHAHYYAQAMYELAHEQSMVDAILADLDLMSSILEACPTFANFLELPFISEEIKYKIIEKVFTSYIHPITLNFWKLLVVKNHSNLLSYILKLYKDIADEKLGRVRATVTSAVPLKEREIQDINKILGDYYHQTVVLSNAVDPNILGGIIVHVKDLWMDSSLSGHLQRVQRKLMDAIKQLAPTITFTSD